jgi:hypothetical protein
MKKLKVIYYRNITKNSELPNIEIIKIKNGYTISDIEYELNRIEINKLCSVMSISICLVDFQELSFEKEDE